jgi:hypothetical protein
MLNRSSRSRAALDWLFDCYVGFIQEENVHWSRARLFEREGFLKHFKGCEEAKKL